MEPLSFKVNSTNAILVVLVEFSSVGFWKSVPFGLSRFLYMALVQPKK